MDPLSGVLGMLGLQAAAPCRLEVGGEWALRFAEFQHIRVGVVLTGSMWLTPHGYAPIRMSRSSFALHFKSAVGLPPLDYLVRGVSVSRVEDPLESFLWWILRDPAAGAGGFREMVTEALVGATGSFEASEGRTASWVDGRDARDFGRSVQHDSDQKFGHGSTPPFSGKIGYGNSPSPSSRQPRMSSICVAKYPRYCLSLSPFMPGRITLISSLNLPSGKLPTSKR